MIKAIYSQFRLFEQKRLWLPKPYILHCFKDNINVILGHLFNVTELKMTGGCDRKTFLLEWPRFVCGSLVKGLYSISS